MLPLIGSKAFKFTAGMLVGVAANQMIGQDQLRQILKDPSPLVNMAGELFQQIKK